MNNKELKRNGIAALLVIGMLALAVPALACWQGNGPGYGMGQTATASQGAAAQQAPGTNGCPALQFQARMGGMMTVTGNARPATAFCPNAAGGRGTMMTGSVGTGSVGGPMMGWHYGRAAAMPGNAVNCW